MSKRDSESRPLNPQEVSQSITLPSIKPRDDTDRPGTSTTTAEPQQHYGRPAGMSNQPSEGRLPPFSQNISPTSSTPQASLSSRTLGVHNILNPSEPAPSGPPLRRYPSGDIGQSPISGSMFLPISSPRPSAQEALRRTSTHSSPVLQEGQEGRHEPRRILTPRSPRATSYGGRSTISASQTPFLGGPRTYTAEPGASDVPPMPQQAPMTYGYIPPAGGENLRKRVSLSAIGEARPAPQSQSTSPTPSLTPSYGSQTATTTRPLQLSQTTPQATYFPGQSFGAPRPGGNQPQSGLQGSEGPFTPERNILSLQGAQSNMRMMPLTSADGTQFYVPVDVQAASKVADEKRARNAGASARFRERRKAKEKEASTAIQKLEHQTRELERRNKELAEQMNHYREERDRFRDIVHRTPGISHLATQVPPTPRESRPVPQYTAPPGQSWEPSSTGISQEMETLGRPARRRRTEEQLPFGTYQYPNPATTLPPVQPATYGPMEAVARPTNLPPLRTEGNPAQGGGQPQASVPSMEQPSRGPYDTYQRHEYERSWPGGPSDPRK